MITPCAMRMKSLPSWWPAVVWRGWMSSTTCFRTSSRSHSQRTTSLKIAQWLLEISHYRLPTGIGGRQHRCHHPCLVPEANRHRTPEVEHVALGPTKRFSLPASFRPLDRALSRFSMRMRPRPRQAQLVGSCRLTGLVAATQVAHPMAQRRTITSQVRYIRNICMHLITSLTCEVHSKSISSLCMRCAERYELDGNFPRRMIILHASLQRGLVRP